MGSGGLAGRDTEGPVLTNTENANWKQICLVFTGV